MANVNQTTALRLLSESWRTEVEYAANPIRGVFKTITDTGEEHFGPGYKIHWPIVGRITASAYAGTVTAVANTETESVITPTVKYAAVNIQEDVLLTSVTDTVKIYSPGIAEAIWQQVDVDILSLFASFTTNNQTDAGDFTEVAQQTLIAKILNTGGDKVMLGELTGVYHPLKWRPIFQIANYTNASVRGENNGPAKTGILNMAYGVNYIFTSNVQTSTTLRNLIFARKAIWLAKKNNPKIEMERQLGTLSTEVVGSQMYGVSALHEVAGGQHQITTLT